MNIESIKADKVNEYIGNDSAIIVDVRSPYDYYISHIPTAINLPYDDFEIEKSSFPKNKILILYCNRGGASLILTRDLCKQGYNVKNVYGGINAYRGPLESWYLQTNGIYAIMTRNRLLI